jgi:hypothetical protein
MNEDIQQSLMELVRAMENLNRAFAKHADDLKKSGNADELQKWINAVHAMQDSGTIYLNWAKLVPDPIFQKARRIRRKRLSR